MGRPGKQILDRLGSPGLSRVLDDLFDDKQLVNLATACGVKYPGMRTQSQKRERLIADLVDRAGKHLVAGKAILRALVKETEADTREWAALGPEQRAERLCDESYLLADGNLGRMLYLVSTDPDDKLIDGFGSRLARQYLVRVASNGSGPPPAAAKALREESRLKRNVTSLQKKIKHAESQLARARESQKTFKRDLIERKGELAESRMLVERLRRELAAAQGEVQANRASAAAPDKTVGDLAKLVRSLASQQKKLLHRVEKLPAAVAPRTAAAETAALGPLRNAVEDLGKRLEAAVDSRSKEQAGLTRQIEVLSKAVRGRKKSAKTSPKSRAKPAERRVGVFIDVQNMYYAARQLKGKLDFDALLEAAVRDRRLIQATAYVVESKETDQSHFIAMLEQRAITVQRKALRVRADGSMKGDWDMELALDILDAAPRLDVVVLVSGDGDFTSLVKRVRASGPRVEVIAFPRNTAKSLVEAADRFQPLDRKFMIYAKKRTKTVPAKAEAAKAAPPAPAPAATIREKAKSSSSPEPTNT